MTRVSSETAFAFSDQGLADSFDASDWKYITASRRWMHWNGKYWQADNTNAIGAVVSDHLTQKAREAMIPKKISQLNATSTERAVIAKIAERRDVACTSDGWDGDPMLFNTPEGTFDLRDGSQHDHDRSNMITNIGASCTGGDDDAWAGFVTKTMGGDAQKVEYLRRVAGYCATGETTEDALFLLYGVGQNGKTTLVEALLDGIGTYGAVGAPDMLMAQRNSQHPTDIAGLYGKRFVANEETEEGAGWAESKIKALTGGGRIKARLMRQDFFEFTPQFKLMIQSNHKPRLKNVGKAMRRRVHLIPFTVTVPESERDPELGNKIKNNIGAVVRWIIKGAKEWNGIGLQPPRSVVDATDAYFEEEDTVTQWMDDMVEGGSAVAPVTGKKTEAPKAYASYSAWRKRQGMEPRANSDFYGDLRTRGFDVKKSNGKNWVLGMVMSAAECPF